MKQLTAMQKLIKSMEDSYHLTEETRYEFKKALEEEREQIIDFHIEVMKKGLIHEGDKEWKDAYHPKIKQQAENYYSQTYKNYESND